MEEFFKTIANALMSLFSNTCALVTGIVTAVVGYLYPTFEISSFLLALFVFDVIFGAWKAKKIKNEKFSMKIVWNTTFPRMLVAFLLITLTYIWDQIAKQHVVETWRIVGLIFAGALIWSIAENGYYITKWIAFKIAAVRFSGVVKDKTGIDINKEMKDETN